MNKRTTDYDAATSLDLTDLIEIVVDIAGTPTNKKVTLANFLLYLGIRTGESGNEILIKDTPKVITFASTHGALVGDHQLIITCRLADDTNSVNYTITDHTVNGFTITPDFDAKLGWTVLDI